jgi:hypothetical protein
MCYWHAENSKNSILRFFEVNDELLNHEAQVHEAQVHEAQVNDELLNHEASLSNCCACLSAAGNEAEFMYSAFADVKMPQFNSF